MDKPIQGWALVFLLDPNDAPTAIHFAEDKFPRKISGFH